MGMNYGRVPVDPTKGQPSISNISFVNVSAAQTSVVASLVGVGPGSIKGLHFDGCAFRATSAQPWALTNVDASSCTSVDTSPPFPAHAQQG